ncbi:MAG: hypothetical protein PUE75_08225 [Eubacteriales bacterium]|nr:hypothetical protein [Eubacteriales bacterium]
MIDIHSHVLPFVDDGSDSLELSFEMLKMASQGSTKGIVLTPHSNLYEYDKNLLYELEFVFDAFKEKVKNQKIPIEIYLGGEVFAGQGVLEYAEKRLLPTINNSRFMLIEFDFYSSSAYIKSITKKLSRMGYVPIVAHPERYECVKKSPSLSMDFMNCGGLLQVNKGAVAGDFGIASKETAFELINHKTAQFIASDAHNLEGRNTDMELAYSIVADEFDDKTAERLFSVNPQTVINNGRLAISRPVAF